MLAVYARCVASPTVNDLHAAAYELLFDAMRRDFLQDPSLLRIERTEDGKPYFVDCDYQFSITHTEGLVAVAISSENVGIDAEPSERRISDAVAKRFLGVENATVKDWTRYESIGKLLGCGVPLAKEQRNTECFTYFYTDLPGYTVCCACREKQIQNRIKLI